ncbi:6026_t:CDS:1, partial [Gigaspora margarita]
NKKDVFIEFYLIVPELLQNNHILQAPKDLSSTRTTIQRHQKVNDKPILTKPKDSTRKPYKLQDLDR